MSPIPVWLASHEHSHSPGLESLVDLACRDGVDIRPTLLRVLTDLYVQKHVHTSEEEHHSRWRSD